MRTILFANEFGSGLGHVNHLVLLAKHFAGDHRLVFALDDTDLATPVLRRAFGSDVTIVQGPRWTPLPAKVAQARATFTLADPFDLFGFGDRNRLGAAVDLWLDILKLHGPDLILADAAPSLRLAAAGRVPMVVVGSGYTVPPPERPLLPIRPWQTAVPPESRAVEASMLAVANEIRAARGGESVDHWADLFQGDDTFVCTLPLFDPYGAYRSRPQTWPYVLPLLRPGPPLPERDGPDIFAYLPANHPALGAVLDTLGVMGRNPQVYVSGIEPRKLADRCRRHVAIHTVPADFAKVLPRCKLLIHHGGLATTFAGMAAGTPQLALPMRLEHAITAQGMAQTGMGIVLSITSFAERLGVVGDSVQQIQENVSFRNAAQHVAQQISEISISNAAEEILSTCNQCLSG